MNLENIFEDPNRIALAVPEDNSDLLEFCNSSPMDLKSFSLRYVRSSNYFSFLEQQNLQTFVFKMLNDDGSLGGLANFGIRYHFYKGEKTKCAYLSDLRVSPTLSKRTRVLWRKHYSSLLSNIQNISEFDGTKFLYTAILADNEVALNSLTNNKRGINYHFLQDYQIINILGKRPRLKFRKSSSFNIRQAKTSDQLAIETFLYQENKKKCLGEFFCPNDPDSELTRRLQRWVNFDIEKFLIAEGKEGEIVGTLLPWDNSSERSMVVEHLSFPYTWIKRALPIMGRPKLQTGQKLNMLYLTHFVIKEDLPLVYANNVAKELVDRIFENPYYSQNYHLFLCSDQEARFSRIKRSYFHTYTKGLYFQVLGNKDYCPENILNFGGEKLNFEIGIM